MAAAVGSYERLGRLLQYPGPAHPEHLEDCLRGLNGEGAEAVALIRRFAEQIDGLSLERLQELFTQTFDLNPVCSLEVGWQLYGEEYARGSFLVHMRGELRRYGIAESPELPDHLTHVLVLLDRLEQNNPEAARELEKVAVIPAVKKMLQAFERKDSPYENVLRAVAAVLDARQEQAVAEVSHG